MLSNVFDLLEKCASAAPDMKALADEKHSVTYGEYLEAADKVSAWLLQKERISLSGKPVAVLIDRNLECIETFLGVAGSGAFYVPIDISMPEQRVALILKELSPLVIIDATGGKVRSDSSVPVEEIFQKEVTDEDRARLRDVRAGIIDTDPVYSVFTSGSTGVPKGVLTSHRGVLDLVQAFHDAFAFPSGSVFGNQTPFDFDGSVKDIYNALFNLGTVEILPRKLFVMPKLLMPYLAERNVNTIIWTASAVRIVSNCKAFDDPDAARPTSIRYVMFSGEVLPVKALNYWMDAYPNTIYVNLYGPTETTCNCTYYKVEQRYNPEDHLPIGRAFRNMRVFLKNKEGGTIRQAKVMGEICVKGTGLSLGYYNNPQTTSKAFVNDPETAGFADRMYKTGDLGYYNEDGNLMFANRMDSQIKHMGHRIELGEIETSLNAMPFIDVACCLYDSESERIFCVYQAKEECRKKIVGELGKSLPKYMWPNKYVWKEIMPMNAHGKIDRTLLKQTLFKKKVK